MIREIITPQSGEYILQIPKEYIDREVEILILPFSYPKSKKKKSSKKDIFSKTSGILVSENIDPIAWQDEIRSEWGR
ncbi:MAG: hypothetical protein Q9M36_13085 [Sulfurovum sp.]|nr:hypothetical protein [Sulfurovum sp.]